MNIYKSLLTNIIELLTGPKYYAVIVHTNGIDKDELCGGIHDTRKEAQAKFDSLAHTVTYTPAEIISFRYIDERTRLTGLFERKKDRHRYYAVVMSSRTISDDTTTFIENHIFRTKRKAERRIKELKNAEFFNHRIITFLSDNDWYKPARLPLEMR